MTTATVTAKQMALRYDSDTGITHNDHFLEYRYTLPESPESYKGRAGVKKGYFDPLAEGDEITIYYWPWWPAGSVLEAEQSAYGRLPFVLTAMLTLIGWIGVMGTVILASGPIR
ncbi:hypothetical protein IQ225_09215 [Synechocystis salina LEGE 06155]|nr:hypothetical protein [Synechocystis salina LEGE 06155]